MDKIADKMKLILSGVMLFIALMLTGSFIAMAVNIKTIVNVVKEEISMTDQHSPEFSLISDN